ncbi:MAG: sulfite exporter TauE/SafE family protein [Bacillota bacterium]
MTGLEVVVCIFAGIGAGIGTGFAGLSAAAFISPMLVVFLGYDAYSAVGIALISDVLASAVSAITYGRQKNIDLKNGLLMMVLVIIFTLVGSYVGSLMPTSTLGGFSLAMTVILGVKFILKPIQGADELGEKKQRTKAQQLTLVFIFSIIIGMFCGVVGAGGGMMMLLVLTSVMHYDLKKAVGTSVMIMTLTALSGALAHFAIDGAPDWGILAVCVASTLVAAQISAIIANKSKPKTLSYVTGAVLIILGIIMIIFNFI